MKLDILAFGIHPDDVELSCSGTLVKHKSLGYKTGICDLTQGEMGSRGSAEIRIQEAQKAAEILQLDMRVNLQMEDVWALDNQENCLKIIQIIRKYKPSIVLGNAIDDRHPDHKKGAKMVKKACFLAGLSKIETNYEGMIQEAYRPAHFYHYIQYKYLQADFVVDISDYFETKFQSILAYSTQFYNKDSDRPTTLISEEKFLEYIRAKDSVWGNNIGVRYAEGFMVDRIIGVNDLTKLI
jgi:N-acetylglucosamine malate deacetylase 1